jgi:hypothetical protein
VLYPSREVRDAVLKPGMEHGVAEGYDKLAWLNLRWSSATNGKQTKYCVS